MDHENNPTASHSPGEDNVVSSSQSEQSTRPQLTRSRRRRRRKTTSEEQGRDRGKAFQVYKFKSRAPPTRCEDSLGPSRIPPPTEDGNIVETLARSASYWMHQEPPPCWVRDCTGLPCLAGGRPSRTRPLQHSPREEESLTPLLREELISMDEGDDGGIENVGAASSQADITSDDAPRSLAEEYSLAPLNTRKKFSAQGFDAQVENYFNQL